MFTRSMLVYFRPGPNRGVVWPFTKTESTTAVASVVIFSFIRSLSGNTACLPEHRKLVKRIISYFLLKRD